MLIESLTLTLAAVLSSVPAPVARTAGGVHAIVLLDLMPDRHAQGARLLVDFVEQAQRDRTVRSIVLVQQANAPNHYIIDMTFADDADYRRFVQDADVRSFRVALFEHLGSSWDERLGSDVA